MGATAAPTDAAALTDAPTDAAALKAKKMSMESETPKTAETPETAETPKWVKASLEAADAGTLKSALTAWAAAGAAGADTDETKGALSNILPQAVSDEANAALDAVGFFVAMAAGPFANTEIDAAALNDSLATADANALKAHLTAWAADADPDAETVNPAGESKAAKEAAKEAADVLTTAAEAAFQAAQEAAAKEAAQRTKKILMVVCVVLVVVVLSVSSSLNSKTNGADDLESASSVNAEHDEGSFWEQTDHSQEAESGIGAGA